ncbi:phage Gp19/Gp15/Gp42 family protein [Leucobacter allii]|uniref:phage Gp19/Gp15/Gp42 family protein n=1 Tax=Leucobacter allii TaxID=2932247 RepID=UPI001FD0256C|nr:phage Gp19/Gp15/Gp42 family protein [Leucobacter allii]UOR02065.1 phage Gp19/Gp15/Gp42 family protein [Leucobacter allii]
MAVTLPEVEYEYVIDHYEGDPEELGRQSYVEKKIAQSIERLRSRFGSRIRARLDSGALTETLFKDTVAEAVLRIVRNPDGYRMEQQGNYQYQLNSAVAAGYLWFTADNMLDLIGAEFSPIGTATIGVHGRP